MGGGTFVLYFSLQYFFELLGWRPLISVSLAYLPAITFHYLLNRIYTFEVRSDSIDTWQSILRYGVVNFVNYLLNLLFVQVTLACGGNVRLGMLIGVFVTTVTGFLLYRYWVFERGLR